MLKIPAAELAILEKDYPGILKTIESMENSASPPCPVCGSVEASTFVVGTTGRTIALASATTRCHLVPNTKADSEGMTWYCASCQHAFA